MLQDIETDPYTNPIVLFILFALSFPKPTGRVGNQNGTKGRRGGGAQTYVVLKCKNLNFQKWVNDHFKDFGVDSPPGWQVNLHSYTKEILLCALKDQNYVRKLELIYQTNPNSKMWNSQKVIKRIKNHENIPNEKPIARGDQKPHIPGLFTESDLNQTPGLRLTNSEEHNTLDFGLTGIDEGHIYPLISGEQNCQIPDDFTFFIQF